MTTLNGSIFRTSTALTLVVAGLLSTAGCAQTEYDVVILRRCLDDPRRSGSRWRPQVMALGRHGYAVSDATFERGARQAQYA